MSFEQELKHEYNEVFKRKLENHLRTQHDLLKGRSDMYETYRRYERAYDNELRLTAFGVQDIMSAKNKVTAGVQDALAALVKLSPDLKEKVDAALSDVLRAPLEENQKTLLELKPGYEDAKKTLPNKVQISILSIKDDGEDYLLLPVDEKDTVHNGLLYELFCEIGNHFAGKNIKYAKHQLLGYTALQANMPAKEFKDILAMLNKSKQFAAEVLEINYQGKEIMLRGPNVCFVGETFSADLSDLVSGRPKQAKAQIKPEHYVDIHLKPSDLQYGILVVPQAARDFLCPVKVPFTLEFPEGDSSEAKLTSGKGQYLCGRLKTMLYNRHPELKEGSVLRVEKVKDKHYKLHIINP